MAVKRHFLIGICDDDERDLKRIGSSVQECIRTIDGSISAECRLFQSGEEMRRAGGAEAFDLLFLDVEMPDEDGFRLAEGIGMSGAGTAIIFVSAHESFVFDSQEYSPVWFVRKGRLERDMLLALRKYFGLVMPKGLSYRFQRGAEVREWSLGDIIYIESRGHMLLVRRTDGKSFELYGSLKEMEQELEGCHFLRVHKSYLANQRYIEEIGKREIYLTDGTVLEMGRDRRKSLREAMLIYERECDGNRGIPY